MVENKIRLGIDLGGTKIEIIALDEAGNTLQRERVKTPQDDYQMILKVIADLVQHTEDTLGLKGTLGICTPGAISPASGLLRNSNSICLNGKPFKQDLEKALGRDISIANDANCFALSEAVDGAAKGKKIVFGVIVGTGTGAGIVIDKKVLNGSNAIAGEWGHNPLPWPKAVELPGLDCYCGKKGCIETWLSGPGFVKNFFASDHRSLSVEQIVLAAEKGDTSCETALCKYEDRMARGLAHVINILDPDVIVLGGGMSNINRLYQNVPRLWEQYIFSDHVNTKLLLPVHGDSSGVRGAAWLSSVMQ